ncbi:hypothetical protein BGZ60DRAFT_529133 [Tricladium varicosporioides]|nr:hypothetical protein BGZ60DRAFT_529133 [Hymenoscyphus varicosporioides]
MLHSEGPQAVNSLKERVMGGRIQQERNDLRHPMHPMPQGGQSNYSRVSRRPLSTISNNILARGPRSCYQRSVMESKDSLRPTDKVHRHEEYTVGVIFSVVIHEHDDDQNFKPHIKPDQSLCSKGVINTKYRKHIVVAVHADRVTAVPIYTYNGIGLKYKTNADEHISIRDTSCEGAEASAESKHGILWAETQSRLMSKDVDKPSWHMMNSVTSVLLTAPYSHKTSRLSTISGKLLPESENRLLDLFRASMLTNGEPAVAPIPKELSQDSKMTESSVASTPTPKASVVFTPVKRPLYATPTPAQPLKPISVPRTIRSTQSGYALIAGSTYRPAR